MDVALAVAGAGAAAVITGALGRNVHGRVRAVADSDPDTKDAAIVWVDGDLSTESFDGPICPGDEVVQGVGDGALGVAWQVYGARVVAR